MRGEFPRETAQRVDPRDARGRDVLHQALLLDHVERRERGGAGERRAAEGGAVVAGLEEIRVRLSHPDRPDGETPAETLGHADRVGLHARVLVGVETPGAADAALHLVEQQHEPVLVAEPPQAAEEFRRARHDAALALDGLDEDRGGGVVDQRRERRHVVEFAEREAGHERTEAALNLLLRRGAHAAERAAVKRILSANDLEALALLAARTAPAVQARELDETLVGLGAAVAEEDTSRARMPRDPPRQLALVGVAEQVAHVHELRGLPLYGGDPARVAVPERVHRDARGEVEVARAGVVPHAAALAAHERERRARVVAHHVRVVEVGRAGAHEGRLVHGGARRLSPGRSRCRYRGR